MSPPKGIHLISTKWVLKIKRLPNGHIDKYKARLCARGFTQQYGIDYFETFAPVVRLESLRILLAIAAAHDMEIRQMDAVSAYLLSELQEDVYTEVPEGLDIDRGKVRKLRKGMPGLKQSGYVWNKKISAFFTEFGLHRTPAEPSVFKNETGTLIVALYVDDIITIATNLDQILSLKRALSSAFEMKDLGEARYVLGINIQRDRQRGTLTIDQHHYIHDLVKEEGLDDKEGTAVPTNGYTDLEPLEKGEPLADVSYYQRLIGKLNWLARGTRFDIAFTVQRLSQFAHKPGLKHLAAARIVLQYLFSTKYLGIQYNKEVTLIGYSDADYATHLSRKSTMGYLFLMGTGAVTWSSRLQRSVSTSTTEAEYHGLAQAGKEVAWIRNFVEQLGIRAYTTEPILIYGDNEGSLGLVQNPLFHARAKHIDVSVHYVREQHDRKMIQLKYIPTSQMFADCLTKPLKKVQHQNIIREIGLRNWSRGKEHEQ